MFLSPHLKRGSTFKVPPRLYFIQYIHQRIQALIEPLANKYKNIQDNCFSVWRKIARL